MMTSLKIHKKGVVSLCDEDLIGKKFSEGEVSLEVNKRFYHGEGASEKEIVEAMKEAKTVNIVGEKSVGIAIKTGILTKSAVKYIEGVPYALIFTL